MEEIWKDVVGYEGYYKISNFGNAKSIDRVIPYHKKTGKFKTKKPGKTLKICVNTNGYEYICLSRNSKYKHGIIHQLVAQAFIPNKLNKRYVNHIDGVKTNNNVNNLEWVTHQENVDHAWANNLMRSGEDSATAKLKNKDVIKIKEIYKKGNTSYSKIAKQFKTSKSNVAGIIKGERRIYG